MVAVIGGLFLYEAWATTLPKQERFLSSCQKMIDIKFPITGTKWNALKNPCIDGDARGAESRKITEIIPSATRLLFNED